MSLASCLTVSAFILLPLLQMLFGPSLESLGQTFLRVTLPLAWRSMLVGLILCAARAISEFGAVVIVAYHPMVASVLIYERFAAYGLRYSQPVAVLLILVCLLLFVMLRFLSLAKVSRAHTSIAVRSAVTPSEFSRVNLRPELEIYLSIPKKSVLPL